MNQEKVLSILFYLKGMFCGIVGLFILGSNAIGTIHPDGYPANEPIWHFFLSAGILVFLGLCFDTNLDDEVELPKKASLYKGGAPLSPPPS